MREILFRGKNEDRGWIYGDLRNYEKSGAKAIFSHELLHRVEVIPATVGQFTGLTDKNGKKIFEGDLIKWEELDDMGWGQSIVGYIVFDEKELSWCVKWRSFEPDFLSEIDSTRLYVVGNIHDNPEWLGVE